MPGEKGMEIKERKKEIEYISFDYGGPDSRAKQQQQQQYTGRWLLFMLFVDSHDQKSCAASE